MSDITEINLRSEEVQEILTRVPNWMIRWGSVVILCIILSLFFVSWLIKYPDVISTQIVITTNVPPEKLLAHSTGKIEAILVSDKQQITKNTPLAVIENAAAYNDVFNLSQAISKNEKTIENFPFDEFKITQLGDIENTFALFQKESTANKLNSQLQPYKVEGSAQSYEAIQLKERLGLLESQKSINQSELELQKKDLERYETLFAKGIIASQELEKHRMENLQSQKNYKNILSTISQLKS